MVHRCSAATLTLALLPCFGQAAPSKQSIPPEIAAAIEKEIEAVRISTPARTIRLSLTEAVHRGVANSFDIKIARSLTAQEKERLNEANARFDPYFLASGNWRKYRYPTVRVLDTGLTPVSEVAVNPGDLRTGDAGFHGTLQTGATYSLTMQGQREDTPLTGWYGINPRNTLLVNLSITQPLLKGGWFANNLADQRIAEQNLSVAQAQYEETVADLVAAIEQGYWNLIYATRKLHVQEQAYRETRAFLALTEQRHAAGYQASQLDVISAKASVETRKYELISAEAELLSARDELVTTINPTGEDSLLVRRRQTGAGRFRLEEIKIEPATEPTFEPLEVNIDEVIDSAFRRRPLYLTYELQITSQEIEIGRRENELLPRLDVMAEWNQHGLGGSWSESFSELGSGRYYSWLLGAQFEVPLFNRTARARLREAQERMWELTFRKKKFENTLIADILKATRGVRAAYWQVSTTRSAAEYADKQLEGEVKRLVSGTSTSYTVLQMANDLLIARLDELRAIINYKTARVSLERSKGTLLDRHHIRVR